MIKSVCTLYSDESYLGAFLKIIVNIVGEPYNKMCLIVRTMRSIIILVMHYF